jgi:hypothetical protein
MISSYSQVLMIFKLLPLLHENFCYSYLFFLSISDPRMHLKYCALESLVQTLELNTFPAQAYEIFKKSV